MKKQCKWGVEWRCSLPDGKVIKGIHTYCESQWLASNAAKIFNDKFQTKYGDMVFHHKAIKVERRFK